VMIAAALICFAEGQVIVCGGSRLSKIAPVTCELRPTYLRVAARRSIYADSRAYDGAHEAFDFLTSSHFTSRNSPFTQFLPIARLSSPLAPGRSFDATTDFHDEYSYLAASYLGSTISNIER
jgi:hypothetical protein